MPDEPTKEDLHFLDMVTLKPAPTKRVRLASGKTFDMYSLLDLDIDDYVDIEKADLKMLPPKEAYDRAIAKLKKLVVGSVDEDFKGMTMRQFFELLAFAAKDIDPRNNARPQAATTATTNLSN